MSVFTKKRRSAYMQLKGEILQHLEAIFSQQLKAVDNQLVFYLPPELHKYIVYLFFQVENQFSYFFGKAFKLGLDNPDRELDQLVSDFYALPPDEVIEKRAATMQKSSTFYHGR